MKIGFTSRVCPEWDLRTIVAQAAELGYDGVELGALQGEAHLPAVNELTLGPDAVKGMFAEYGIELVCLGTAETLASSSSHEMGRARERILEVVALAGRLGCPFVRAPIGPVPQGHARQRALSRIASAFKSLSAPAGQHHVALLVENGGGYAGSDDVWFVVDHAAHPAVAACWNPCVAMTQRERPTISVPRLGARIKLVHVCDGSFDGRGRFGGFKPPGEGDVELRRMIDFLRGIVYRGYLMFDWPKSVVADLPEAQDVLPTVQVRLREWIDARADVLSAYRGDKKAVRLDLPDTGAPRPKVAKVASTAE